VPIIANAISYIWTLPSGASRTSITNSITIDYSSSAVSGNITVNGNNDCGDGVVSSLEINVTTVPAAAGTISGPTVVCQGQTNVTYTVPVIANATTYIWTLPSGVSGTSTTNNISVNYSLSAISGSITVKGNNSCGDGDASSLEITVSPLPSSAGTITGQTTVCQGQNSVAYTVPAIANATSYVWTLPSGASGTSSTNNITVNYGITATSGNVTVKGNNSCGDGSTSYLAIIVNPLPANAGTIAGPTTVCQGQTSVSYTVPTISNATSYVWTLPGGASGTSTTKSISVNYSLSAISGSIAVKGNNSCGDGNSSTLAIIVNETPATPSITANVLVLHSDAPAGNQWYNSSGLINGATYQDYTVTSNDNYYDIVTLNGCSSEVSNIITITIGGIELNEINKTAKVYPNPVSDELIIELDGNKEDVTFEILNSIGNVVLKGSLIEKTVVQTNSLAPGLYLIKLENGKTFEFKKLVKE